MYRSRDKLSSRHPWWRGGENDPENSCIGGARMLDKRVVIEINIVQISVVYLKQSHPGAVNDDIIVKWWILEDSFPLIAKVSGYFQKAAAVVGKIVIKELKYKNFRFYFITDGYKIKFLKASELQDTYIFSPNVNAFIYFKEKEMWGQGRKITSFT